MDADSLLLPEPGLYTGPSLYRGPSETIYEGESVIIETIGEYTIRSPPIPRDRSVYLNGHVKSKAAQLWSSQDRDEEVPFDRKGVSQWARPEFPTPRGFLEMLPRERTAFLEREKTRRREGVWFFLDGTPTYLTGKAYFWLAYYNLDVGLPDYRENDRQFWGVWEIVLRAPNCYGLYFQARRQEGKSFKAGCILLEAATRISNMHGGVQSKTDPDAKKFLRRAVVKPWQKLMPWFKPRHAGSTKPSTHLDFSAPAKRSKADVEASRYAEIEALESLIEFANSRDEAFDGVKLGVFINDEVGKDQLFDPYERWDVVKKMMRQRGRIIGKSLATTTSAQRDKEKDTMKKRNGLANATKFWRNSNHTAIDHENPNEQTESGLWRLMRPAYEGDITDAYGRSDVVASKRIYDEDRARAERKGDMKALLGLMRAFPYNAEEMLMPDSSKCVFDVDAVMTSLRFVENAEKPLTLPYSLSWSTNAAGEKIVLIKQDREGPWQFVPEVLPLLARNLVREAGTITDRNGQPVRCYAPLNSSVCALTADPFMKDLDDTARLDQISDGAAHLVWYFEATNEQRKNQPGYHPSGGYVGQLKYRPKKASDFKEELRKAAHLFGCKLLAETNAGDPNPHFREYGSEAFIAVASAESGMSEKVRLRGGVVAGATTNAWRVRKLAGWIEQWLAGDPRYFPFADGLREFLVFDPANTTPFDLTSSASLGATILMPYAEMLARLPAQDKNVTYADWQGILPV